MSKNKTLVTILFITIALFISFNSIKQANCNKYNSVNSTEENVIEETIDKTISKNDYQNIEKVLNTETSSRSTNVNRQEPVTYIKSSSERLIANEENIYGVKVSTYYNVSYDIYSNGYKSVTNIIETKETDPTSYNGNTADLLYEANENIIKYKEEIKKNQIETNQYRAESNLQELILDDKLCEAAAVRALEMAYTEKTSHIRPDGARCFQVLEDLSIEYTVAGENVCDSFTDSKAACMAWKNSEGHYKNMISNKYNKIGIGLAKGINGKMYWVQIFSN